MVLSRKPEKNAHRKAARSLRLTNTQNKKQHKELRRFKTLPNPNPKHRKKHATTQAASTTRVAACAVGNKLLVAGFAMEISMYLPRTRTEAC